MSSLNYTPQGRWSEQHIFIITTYPGPHTIRGNQFIVDWENNNKGKTKNFRRQYRKISYFGAEKIFLNKAYKILTIQENTDKFEYIKNKNVCSSVDTVNEWNNMLHTELRYVQHIQSIKI